MLFRQLFDSTSSTYTYLIGDTSTQTALLVDPVLEQIERDLKLLQELELTLRYCLETHIHADHITGTAELRTATGCLGVVPKGAEADCADLQIANGETLQFGSVMITAIATPGHTNHHMAYQVRDEFSEGTCARVLTGDALLIRGCGRTDFQGGDAGALFDSVTQHLFTLPDDTLVYPGHDYRGLTVSTIKEEKRWNSRFISRDRSKFMVLMANLKLPAPQKMMEAVPANEQCGNLVVKGNG